MRLLRTQDNVPDVYVRESRDFQLLCRLYDCAVNGAKLDADAIQFITDTKFCTARLLQLLQTKLGFFTNHDITDDELRLVLEAFPVIMKNKGSLKAIKQAMYVYLKVMHLNTDINVTVINKDEDSPYTIRVGIQSSWRDTTILDEIFRYIMPTGYVFEYVFYTSLKDTTNIVDIPKTNVLYVGDALNSQIRGNGQWYVDTTEDNLINSAAMTEVVSNDEETGLIHKEYPTQQ
jgi:hypothetical protein